MATKSTKTAKKDRHPPHLAREIRGLCTGNFCGWSIYPEQLEPMARRMQRRLTHLRARVITGRQADLLICRQLLREIGLVPPAAPLRPAGRPGFVQGSAPAASLAPLVASLRGANPGK